MRRMKVIISTLLCGLLGACNIATSHSPMFSAPPSKTLTLKNGLWVQQDPECAFEANLPLSSWPTCAEGAVVEGARIRDRDRKPDDVSAYVLIDHSPAILQIYQRVGREAKEDYFYLAADVGRDGAGEVTSIIVWPIRCGIQERGRTVIRPFKGFSEACEPASATVLLREAGRQRPEDKMTWKWVRAAP